MRARAAEATTVRFQIKWAKMPPKLIKAIGEGRVPTESDRRKMVFRLVEDVRSEVPFAERSIFDRVAEKINRQFPDSFGDIFIRSRTAVSLLTQLKDCFDNAKRKDTTPLEIEAPILEQRAYGCRRWRLAALPEGETPEGQEAKRLELNELYRTVSMRQWPWEQILEKMEATYGTLRREINTSSKVIYGMQLAEQTGKRYTPPRNVNIEECQVPCITDRWPFLFQVQSVVQHFSLLTGTGNIRESILKFLEDYFAVLLEFFLQGNVFKKEMQAINRLYEKNRTAENEPSLKILTLMLMLSTYFKDRHQEWMNRVDVSLPRFSYN